MCDTLVRIRIYRHFLRPPQSSVHPSQDSLQRMQMSNRVGQAAILIQQPIGSYAGSSAIDMVAACVARGGAHLFAGANQGNEYLAYGLQMTFLGDCYNSDCGDILWQRMHAVVLCSTRGP